jgi:hypothetical protein
MLRGWALPEPPRPSVRCVAEMLADHRVEYLDYEGPVSGGRGEVSQWDSGRCDLLVSDEDRIVLQVAGMKLQGRVELQRCPTDDSAAGATSWQFQYVSADAG